MRWLKRGLLMLVALIGVLTATFSSVAEAPTTSRRVALIAPIEGMIDMGLVPFVERVLRQAEETNAAVVIFEVNTFGGRVDAAVGIRDRLLKSRVQTVAFVNQRAISAGALISLAAEKIFIASGGTIGAATPVQMGKHGTESSPTDEKTVSYVRKEFRATADARGRPGLIAEAMVDTDVELPGLVEKGKLLTLTSEEALHHGLADARAEDAREVLRKLGLADAELIRVDENWAEHVVRFLTHPVVSSLLMTLALLGIVVELRTPGLGLPGIVGLLSLGSFFWGHWLVELVGWEQLILVVGGVALLVVEIFLIPGFGVAGVLGIISLVAGLSSSLFGAGASLPAVVFAVMRVAISAAAALVLSLLLWRIVRTLPFAQKLVLGTELTGDPHAAPEESSTLDGLVGTSLTPLRPAGIASLGGRRVDVVSLGDFIDAGQPIEVVRDDGNRVVVRLHQPPNRNAQQEFPERTGI